MITNWRQRWIRMGALTIALLTMLGILGAAPGHGVAAQPSGPAPTVNWIKVDNYDCATGTIDFTASVANVPHVPDGSSESEYPLAYYYEARYEDGSVYVPRTEEEVAPGFFLPQSEVWNPPADQSPFTGTVSLSLTVPTTAPTGSGPDAAPIDSIGLTVAVGYGGPGQGATHHAVFSHSLHSFPVDCDGESSNDYVINYIVQSLIRLLIEILFES